MGKFSGYVLCSDIDGTLIDNDHNISQENLDAIAYFKKEGGLFTVATGRTPYGTSQYIQQVKPSLPVICQNGCAIYDFGAKEYLWTMELDDGVTEAIEYVMDRYPFAGVEIIGKNDIYLCRENAATKRHREYEGLEHIKSTVFDVPKPWLKILFAQEAEETNFLRSEMEQTPFREKYQIVKSHQYYFEIFHKDGNKGAALRKLAEIAQIPLENMIAIGDNDNDAQMLEVAGISAAVGNATTRAKKAAKMIVNDNCHSAVADLIFHRLKI